MNLALDNGMFQELSSDEMFAIEGGGFWDVVGTVACGVIAVCVMAPVSPIILCAGVAAGITYGVYQVTK